MPADFEDNFNRSDSNIVGNGWIENESGGPSSIRIESNSLKIDSPDSNLVKRPAGENWVDGEIRVDINLTTSNYKNIVYARFLDITNFWALIISENKLSLYVSLGSPGLVDEFDTLNLTIGINYTVRFIMLGNLATGDIFNQSGGLEGSVSGSASEISTSGSQALSSTFSRPSTFDNFISNPNPGFTDILGITGFWLAGTQTFSGSRMKIVAGSGTSIYTR